MSVYDSRSSANVGAGDLTGAAAAISGSQTTCVAAMDSKYRLNIADQNRTRTEHAEVPANGTERRDAANSDVIATKEVEYIKSFVVMGDDQAQKTEYIRKCLLASEGNNVKTKLVQLIISLSGIRVSDLTGQKTLMAHALKRIAFATCFPEHHQFTFIAREPKATTDEQFCHAFRARSPREAQELNVLVAGAFRTAYAHSQSPLTSTRHLSHAAIDTQPSSSSEERSWRAGAGHVDEQLSAADRRRQRRPAAETADEQRRHHQSRDQRHQPSDVAVTSANTQRPSVDHHAQRQQHQQQQLRPGPASQRAKSESPPSALSTAAVTTASAAVVHRTATAPVFANDATAATTSITSTSVTPAARTTTQHAATPDVSLMWTLLRALRSYSTTPTATSCQAGCHGSPVMVLKDLIDAHFSEAAAAAAAVTSPSHASPINFTSRNKNCSSSSRSRPMSGVAGDWDVLLLNGGDVLTQTSADDCLSHNAAVRSVVADGNSPSEDLCDAAWYQPGVPRDKVLDRLAQRDVGSFVVRDSTTHAGCYALSIRVDRHDADDHGISHFLITGTPRGTVKLKGMSKEWNSLTALVTHHTVMRELLPCLLVLPTDSTSRQVQPQS